MGNLKNSLLAGCGIALVVGSPAFAQKADGANEDEPLKEVVVTGTLIRGTAPLGASAVDVTAEDIEKAGVTDSTQLLARVPQLGTFGQLPTPIGSGAGIIMFPPAVRGLPSLVLFNGQRIPPIGLLQSDPNVNAIPPSLMERVEVLPGGGSALYGSDAVGGVINFIPKRKIDGFLLNAHTGAGDGYDTRGGDIDYGTSWASGSMILAYSYDHHSDLAGADRRWFTQDPVGTGLRNTLCSPGNVTVGTQSYSLPNLTPGGRTCDLDKFFTIYPEYDRHSFYASLTQNFSDSVQFSLMAWTSKEHLQSDGTYFFADTNADISGTITNANPYFRPIGAETSQNFSQVLTATDLPGYELGRNNNHYTTSGITPSLTVDLPFAWRSVLSYNYGATEVNVRTNTVNAAALGTALLGTTPATAYDPYDPDATNAGVLQSIFGSVADRSHGRQYMQQGRVVFDGPVARMPGGQLKAAIGYEHQKFKIQRGQLTAAALDAPFPREENERDVDSLFAELSLPLVGNENSRPGVERLELSAAVRHDKYSDPFVSTNPKLGFTYVPTGGLTFHGQWGKAFHAADLAYTTGATQLIVVPAFIDMFPQDLPLYGNPERLAFVVVGANPGNIKPETSNSWELGADFAPASLPGARFGLTYFQVKFHDKIDYPQGFPPNLASAPFFDLHPSAATLQAAAARYPTGLPFPASVIPTLYNDPRTVPYALVSFYPQNLADIRLTGIDLNFAYDHATDFGAWRAGVGGTHYLSYETQPLSLSYYSNLDDGQPSWIMQGNVGVTVRKFSADVRVDYRGDAPQASSTAIPTISAYTTTNVVLSYDLGKVGPLNTAQISLNVDNLFDVDPPQRLQPSGAAFTSLGRVATLHLSTSF